MNMLLIIVIVLGCVLLLSLALLIIKGVDWRSFFVRRYGNDYRKGLAHIKVKGEWLYRESELIYESDIACTYTRETATGDILDDIVPNAIGYAYDEYTGRRVYKVMPGAIIAQSDDGDAPAYNMPSALLSTETLGKIAFGLATSVKSNDAGGFNWKLLIVGAVIVVVIVGGLFVTGVIKSPAAQQAQPETKTEAPAPEPAEDVTFINE